ncbi:MAG: tetratricopeptide repeat protein [Rhizobiaceae bacterium]
MTAKQFFLSILICFALGCHSSVAQETGDAKDNDQKSREVAVESDMSNPEISRVDQAFSAYQRGMYLTAFDLALPVATEGNAAAQTLIAELYERGLGIPQNLEEATDWYEIAAKSGNREAQFAYGVKLLEGKYIEKNVELGLEMMKAAADAGHPTAMFNYATHLVNERPTSSTYRKALPLFEKAAEYRLADAYYSLAKIYDDGLATGINDPEKGLYWLEKAASSGIDTAQVELAIKLLNMPKGERDAVRAFSLLKLAANRGNVIAQNRLSHMLFEGIGTEKSDVEAAMWHILASRSGRNDFDLDLYLHALPIDVRQQALAQANRWPSVR